MDFEGTSFKIGFTICNLKICHFQLNSKYFFNQTLSHDSGRSGEFLWYIISQKRILNLVKLQQKD